MNDYCLHFEYVLIKLGGKGLSCYLSSWKLEKYSSTGGCILIVSWLTFMIVYDYDRREALGIWKSRLGSRATYRALTEVFFKAGRLDYADAVCSLLKDNGDTRGI